MTTRVHSGMSRMLPRRLANRTLFLALGALGADYTDRWLLPRPLTPRERAARYLALRSSSGVQPELAQPLASGGLSSPHTSI